MNINIQTLTTRSFGGNGGVSFKQRGIRTLSLRHGSRVNAITINGEIFGGNGGTLSNTITLAHDEFISQVDIRHGSVIDYLKIVTNKGQLVEGGGSGGKLSIVKGTIIAFGGKSGVELDQLEVFGNI